MASWALRLLNKDLVLVETSLAWVAEGLGLASSVEGSPSGDEDDGKDMAEW